MRKKELLKTKLFLGKVACFFKVFSMILNKLSLVLNVISTCFQAGRLEKFDVMAKNFMKNKVGYDILVLTYLL